MWLSSYYLAINLDTFERFCRKEVLILINYLIAAYGHISVLSPNRLTSAVIALRIFVK